MMSWFDERGLKGWYSRISGKRKELPQPAQETVAERASVVLLPGTRKELSESVEETLKDTPVQLEDWDDEDAINIPQSKKTSLIPPRLSLQSKPLPAVNTSSTEKGKSRNLTTDVLPAAETTHAVTNNQRLAGRTTKVRLQTVSKVEHPALPVESRVPYHETEAYSSLSALKLLDTTHNPTQAVLTGSGKFEAEQSDAAVPNENITSTSVVLVTLTSDPGPVVIKYISLQPGLGFTVHLTATTQNCTSFNYAILNGS
jgi:hypothetical protein